MGIGKVDYPKILYRYDSGYSRNKYEQILEEEKDCVILLANYEKNCYCTYGDGAKISQALCAKVDCYYNRQRQMGVNIAKDQMFNTVGRLLKNGYSVLIVSTDKGAAAGRLRYMLDCE